MGSGGFDFDEMKDLFDGKAFGNPPISPEILNAWNKKIRAFNAKILEIRKGIEARTEENLSNETIYSTINYFLAIRASFVDYKKYVKSSKYILITKSEINLNATNEIINITGDLATQLEFYSRNKESYSRVMLLMMIDDLLPNFKNLLPPEKEPEER